MFKMINDPLKLVLYSFESLFNIYFGCGSFCHNLRLLFFFRVFLPYLPHVFMNEIETMILHDSLLNKMTLDHTSELHV